MSPGWTVSLTSGLYRRPGDFRSSCRPPRPRLRCWASSLTWTRSGGVEGSPPSVMRATASPMCLWAMNIVRTQGSSSGCCRFYQQEFCQTCIVVYSLCVCVCVCVCVCLYDSVCACMHMCVFVSLCMWVHACMCLYVCMYVCVCLCMGVCLCQRKCMWMR